MGTSPSGVLTRASYGWQAETCCGEEVPTLNHTGELKLNTWCSRAQVSSCSNSSASSGVAK